MSVPGEFTAGDVLAASEMNDLPGGVLGEATATGSQTFTSEADATGLSVTVSPPAGRKLRISASIRLQASGTGDRLFIRIKEGTTELGTAGDFINNAAATGRQHASGWTTVTPSAGSHTYKLTGERVTGTGTTSIQATADSPSRLLVEDIGPA